MPVSTLGHIAALAAAIPHLTVSLDTHGGSTVIVGDFPEASMCSHAFRQVVTQWPAHSDHHPCVETVVFDGADERGPVLATGPVRWFATDLSAEQTVSVLRASKPRSSGISVQVRFDTVLGLSVVRMESSQMDDAALDDIAIAAYAGCEVAHLIGAAQLQ